MQGYLTREVQNQETLGLLKKLVSATDSYQGPYRLREKTVSLSFVSGHGFSRADKPLYFCHPEATTQGPREAPPLRFVGW